MHRTLATLALVPLAVGCGGYRLHDERVLTLEVGEIRTIAVAAVDVEQTIHIEARAAEATFDVHVYLPEHEEEIERSLTLGKPAENLLASAEGVTESTLSATIPAGKEAIVRLYPAERKQTTVNVVIAN